MRKFVSTGTALAVSAIAALWFSPGAIAADVMRCSHQLPPSHQIAKAINKWAAEIRRAAGGALDVQIFGANSLVDAKHNILSVAKGDIECAFSVNFQWGRTLPMMNVTLRPFSFGGVEVFQKWPKSEAAGFLSKKLLQKGVKNVVWMFQGDSSVFTSKGRFLNTPESFKGVKIRGLVPAYNASLQAMGAVPVTMSGGEVYQGLATGVIDAAQTGVGAAVARKYYEVQNHFTVVPVISVYFHGYINPRWYDRLSEKAQKAIDATGLVGAAAALEEAKEEMTTAPGKLREKGVKVHVASDAENNAFEAAMRPAFDAKFGNDEDSKSLLKLVDKLRK